MNTSLVEDFLDFLGDDSKITSLFTDHMETGDNQSICQLPCVEIMDVHNAINLTNIATKARDINILGSALKKNMKTTADQRQSGEKDQQANN